MYMAEKQEERLLKLEEVAIIIGSSSKSINNWYWFKRENPNNEYAKMLPNYVQYGPRQTRYWKESDIWKLVKFKQSIPQGRNGIMGSVTQRYYRKEDKNDNAEVSE
jgi:predicted DNA-binding transcriptional regulator AlpA